MSDHGVTGSRGSDGCGEFHEYAPGPDGFCDCCRLHPDVVKPIEAWWSERGKAVPQRATREWRVMLDAWVEAGRPNVTAVEKAQKKLRGGK